jgi:hypothetical protein
MSVMKRSLQAFRRDILAMMEEASRIVTHPKFHVKPGPDSWSAAECLDHLTLTARSYRDIIDLGVREAPRGDVDYRPGLIWRWFVNAMEPPVRRKIKTIAPFLPATKRGAETVLKEFMESHQALLDRLDQLQSVDLRKVKMTSPFASWLRYPLGLAFYLIPAHCRRHLWQANQALNEDNSVTNSKAASSDTR